MAEYDTIFKYKCDDGTIVEVAATCEYEWEDYDYGEIVSIGTDVTKNGQPVTLKKEELVYIEEEAERLLHGVAMEDGTRGIDADIYYDMYKDGLYEREEA